MSSSPLHSSVVAVNNQTISWATTGQGEEQQPAADVPGQPFVPRTNGVYSLLQSLRYSCDSLGLPTAGILDSPAGPTDGADNPQDGDYDPGGLRGADYHDPPHARRPISLSHAENRRASDLTSPFEWPQNKRHHASEWIENEPDRTPAV